MTGHRPHYLRFEKPGLYLAHFACFECRRSWKHAVDYGWKRPEGWMPPQCQSCRRMLVNMGRKFHVPPRRDLAAWRLIEGLASALKFRRLPSERPLRTAELGPYLKRVRIERDPGAQLLERISRRKQG